MKKTFHKKDIPNIAKEILRVISHAPKKDGALVVALSGDLGAGKTTLTQTIARELGIKETVISPTFVLMKKYPIKLSTFDFQLLTHIDAYRFDSADELLRLGWHELLADKNNLILIEWPERVAEIMPKDVISISLAHVDEETRNIDVR